MAWSLFWVGVPRRGRRQARRSQVEAAPADNRRGAGPGMAACTKRAPSTWTPGTPRWVASDRRAVSSAGQSACLTRRRSLVRAQHRPSIHPSIRETKSVSDPVIPSTGHHTKRDTAVAGDDSSSPGSLSRAWPAVATWSSSWDAAHLMPHEVRHAAGGAPPAGRREPRRAGGTDRRARASLVARPDLLGRDTLLALQRSAGNAAVAQLLRRAPTTPKTVQRDPIPLRVRSCESPSFSSG